MKKFLVVILCCFFVLPAAADDIDLPATGDLWDNWDVGQPFYGQEKSVTDEDFDKAIESVKSKKDKWTNRLKKKQIPKGEEVHQSNETDAINSQDVSTRDEGHPVLSLPVNLRIGDSVLPVGHYQVKAEKDGDEVFLKLYQSQYLMAQVPAIETNDDFGEDTISFVKWIAEGDDKIKLIFGSMDLNAYTFVEISE
ncbi:MAG: hypothetical protein NC191_05880 [Muribaculaceae bacterium]|nr:hypothetical protein [Muribaculaceae bacterium]